MGLYTPSGPRRGPILYRKGLGDIDVLRFPDDRTPIGKASSAGSTDGGVALWQLTVGGAEFLGRWVVLGGEFFQTK
jgi:hypothetical protein